MPFDFSHPTLPRMGTKDYHRLRARLVFVNVLFILIVVSRVHRFMRLVFASDDNLTRTSKELGNSLEPANRPSSRTLTSGFICVFLQMRVHISLCFRSTYVGSRAENLNKTTLSRRRAFLVTNAEPGDIWSLNGSLIFKSSRHAPPSLFYIQAILEDSKENNLSEVLLSETYCCIVYAAAVSIPRFLVPFLIGSSFLAFHRYNNIDRSFCGISEDLTELNR